ncbi:hypothetical protein SAMN04487905_109253 [Actinopolyspora xinjiangensis]|uniref:DUF397 domain-containing protein n=1 Tax=Actinopolyspora xinjiangensis TaxID=405564 RepID=A0A1H0VU68_9ACTN|nr:hypothetical protein SAMN04487905_109253 [Actinopolyspora xinjiangensis]
MSPGSFADAVWSGEARSSGNGGACVEVGFTPDAIGVCDVPVSWWCENVQRRL